MYSISLSRTIGNYMKSKKYLSRLLSLIALNALAISVCAQMNMSAKQFPLVNQLPSNTVKRIFQDSEGYMWFGTLDGLCRYDGYRVVTFRSNTSNPKFLTENEINYIAEDKNDNLWIGTNKGINVLNKKTYRITQLDNEYVDNTDIRYIKVAQDGNIWVGTYSSLLCFNPDLTLKKRYEDTEIPSTSTNCIYEDAEGNIWISMWNNGLFRYNKATDSFIKYPPIGDNNNNPFSIFQDEKGQFWIGTWGGGLYLFNPNETGEKMYTQIDVYNKESKVKERTFFSITQDNRNKYIWVMSFSGIYAFEYDDNNNIREVNVSYLFKDFNNIFSDIIKDWNGNLWVGTFSEGIINIDFDKPEVQNLNLSHVKQLTGITPNVTAIYRDSDGVVWFDQNRWGMGLYYPDEQKITFHQQLPTREHFSNFACMADFRSLPQEIWLSPQLSSTIYSLTKTKDNIKVNYRMNLVDLRQQPGTITKFHEDKNNNIWVATTGGVFVKPHNEEIKPLIFSLGTVTDLTEDNEGNIWVSCTDRGFYKLPPLNGFDESKVIHFSTGNSNLKSDKIMALCVDSNNRLWIGTKEGHIIVYDIAFNEFLDASKSFKMIGEKIQNILKDNYGHIWVSTNKRLTEYNPNNGASRDYSKADGISVNSFLRNSYYLDKEGNIYFGGNGGISVFYPSDKLAEGAKNTPSFITDVKINNQSLLLTDDDRNLDLLSYDMVLKPGDKNIEIGFSSLNYSFPSKIQYAYKMEGIDDDWVYTEYNRQFAFYNQLPKGKHVFLVKSTDENGLWSDKVTRMTIYKEPAFYETWWAYLIYLALLVAFAYSVYIWTRNRIRLRNDLRIAQIEKNKSEELTQVKLRYFTNISHDFLTPLTIISCLIDDIETTIKGKLTQFDLMRSNINRLRRLLQQVLDFRKVESGNMKLKISDNDIVKFIRELCYVHFSPLMKKKSIELKFGTNKDSVHAYFDADKIDKIVFNLLSNAYKYTPSGGKVEVGLTEYEEGAHTLLAIKVKDTGVGISAEDQKNIFTRFYNNKMVDSGETNGIGLSLTKDLIELHRGTISVESEIDKGTAFIITIPIDRESYGESDLDSSQSILIYEKVVDVMSLEETDNYLPDSDIVQEEVTVLLVEDNPDLLSLMNNILSKHFHIETARNGLEALSLVKEKEIDIIISDVMMPEMDGLELCKTLKNDIETSHIPLILLTAKSSIDDRIECYKAGADGYISKPFELKLLEARINSFLLKKREKQRDFKSNFEVNVSVLEHPTIDEQFLNDTVNIIQEYLSEPNFDVIFLAKKLNMSKSSLYRKIKTLTDLSPSDFIRNIKLKQACQMLRDKSITISEVAYLTGFSDPKYFSTCFKNEFSITPSEYQKQENS